MAKGFIHSQTQAMSHEFFLKTKQKLDLVDENKIASSIDYGDKSVERVSVSLWGFSRLQDNMFVSQFLHICARGSFQSNDPASAEKLSKVERDFYGPFRELAKEIDDFKPENKSPFVDARFLSVSNMLLLLDFAHNNESLVKELMRTKRISTSTRDFVTEYWNALCRAIDANETGVSFPYPSPTMLTDRTGNGSRGHVIPER